MPFAPLWPAAQTLLSPAATTAMAHRLARALATDETARAVGDDLGGSWKPSPSRWRPGWRNSGRTTAVPSRWG